MIGDYIVVDCPIALTPVCIIVIGEEYGVSTCRVALIGRRQAKAGDYIIRLGNPLNPDYIECILIENFRVDAYSSKLPPATGRVSSDMLPLLAAETSPSSIYRVLPQWKLDRVASKERKLVTSWLWETYCVPVIKGGVVR